MLMGFQPVGLKELWLLVKQRLIVFLSLFLELQIDLKFISEEELIII